MSKDPLPTIPLEEGKELQMKREEGLCHEGRWFESRGGRALRGGGKARKTPRQTATYFALEGGRKEAVWSSQADQQVSLGHLIDVNSDQKAKKRPKRKERVLRRVREETV